MSFRSAYLLLTTACLTHHLVMGQPVPSGTNAATPPPCNPVISICPAGSFDCETSPEVGSVVIYSPNDRSVYFQNEPLNITWSYSERTLTNFYPVQKVSIYISVAGMNSWRLFGEVNASRTSFVERNLMDWGIGQFQLRVLPDNLNQANGDTIGQKSSCTPAGYPLGTSSRPFLVTTRKIYSGFNYDNFTEDPKDPNSPNGPTSDALSTKSVFSRVGESGFGKVLWTLVTIVLPWLM